jgi:hypothetical protein
MRSERLKLGVVLAIFGVITFFWVYGEIADRFNPNLLHPPPTTREILLSSALAIVFFAVSAAALVSAWRIPRTSKEFEASLRSTYAAWRCGILTEIKPGCEKAARRSFSDFVAHEGLASPARAFVNSYSPNTDEFLISSGDASWIRRSPSHVLTSDRIVIWTDRAGIASESVALAEVEAVQVVRAGWQIIAYPFGTATLHIVKSGGQNVKFARLSDPPNPHVLAWAVARARVKASPAGIGSPLAVGAPGASRARTKQTEYAPGDYLPALAPYPGQGTWSALAWLAGVSAGAIGAIAFAWGTLRSVGSGGIAGIGGFLIFGAISVSVRQSIVRRKALAHYRRVLATGAHDDPDTCVQLGMWFRMQDESSIAKIEEGDSYFRRALEQCPGHRDAIIALAASLASNRPRKADPRAVIDLLEPWLNDHEDFYGELLFAEGLEALPDRGKAAQHFRRILELYPRTPKRKDIMDFLGSQVLSGGK